jgi:hypothetical protein
MWILFGTNHDTVEQEPYVYFIGIFDNIDTAKAKRQLCISSDMSGTERKAVLDDYFIKEVEMNRLYDLDWSNGWD